MTDSQDTNKQQQEPVAYLVDGDLYYPEEIDWETLQEQGHTVAALYTSPPAQRKPLTDDEIYGMYNEPRSDAEMVEFARAIEAAHGIKENT